MLRLHRHSHEKVLVCIALRRATLSARRWAPRVRMCLPAALDRLRWASAAATGFRGGPEASSFKGASPPGACPAAGGRCCVPLGEGRAVDTYPPAAINDAGCGNGPRPFGLSPRARNASLLVSCWCLPAPSSRLALRARGGNGGASSRRICPKGCFMRRSFLSSPWAKARDSFLALMVCTYSTNKKTPAMEPGLVERCTRCRRSLVCRGWMRENTVQPGRWTVVRRERTREQT